MVSDPSTIPDFTTGSKSGEQAMFLTSDGEGKLLDPLKHALIGNFIKKRPPLKVIRDFFQSQKLTSEAQFGILDRKKILIQCSPDDYTRLRVKGTCFIEGSRVRFTKYSVENFHKSEAQTAPIWIEMPGLPVHLFSKDFLFMAVQHLGDPITLDKATTRLSRPGCARICVDCPLGKPLPQRLWIQESVGGFWQYLKFGKFPPFCNVYSAIGHSNAECKKGSKSESGQELKARKTAPSSFIFPEILAHPLPSHGLPLEASKIREDPSTEANSNTTDVKDNGKDLVAFDQQEQVAQWLSNKEQHPKQLQINAPLETDNAFGEKAITCSSIANEDFEENVVSSTLPRTESAPLLRLHWLDQDCPKPKLPDMIHQDKRLNSDDEQGDNIMVQVQFEEQVCCQDPQYQTPVKASRYNLRSLSKEEIFEKQSSRKNKKKEARRNALEFNYSDSDTHIDTDF